MELREERNVPFGALTLVRADARHLREVPDSSIALVVTSPPYPMIPQWDALFVSLGATDYPGMHRILRDVWSECARVLVPGGILAVNIGDAVRSIDGKFQLWPNHATVLVDAVRIGLRPLPPILWKKPTNKPNAFLGSGFLPPNAYVTLDCEYILLFRKGDLRRLPRRDAAREASRYSRRERDRWFSQIWTGIRGARQGTGPDRTAAFPPEIPNRLIRMFSIVGDTVLDPFAGTGTTLWCALRLGRNAVGAEIDGRNFSRLLTRAKKEAVVPVVRYSSAPRPLVRDGPSPRRPRA
jgi:modification methylase